jgi:hypothetical protein
MHKESYVGNFETYRHCQQGIGRWFKLKGILQTPHAPQNSKKCNEWNSIGEGIIGTNCVVKWSYICLFLFMQKLVLELQETFMYQLLNLD